MSLKDLAIVQKRCTDFVSKRKENAIKRRSSALLIHLVAPLHDTRLCTKLHSYS